MDTLDIYCICEVPVFPISALWGSTSWCICELSVYFLSIRVYVVLQEAGSQLSGSAACTQSRGTGLCKLPVSPSSTTAVPTVMMLGEHVNDYRSSLRENNWSLLKTTAFRLWRQVFVQILGCKISLLLTISTCQLQNRQTYRRGDRQFPETVIQLPRSASNPSSVGSNNKNRTCCLSFTQREPPLIPCFYPTPTIKLIINALTNKCDLTVPSKIKHNTCKHCRTRRNMQLLEIIAQDSTTAKPANFQSWKSQIGRVEIKWDFLTVATPAVRCCVCLRGLI